MNRQSRVLDDGYDRVTREEWEVESERQNVALFWQIVICVIVIIRVFCPS